MHKLCLTLVALALCCVGVATARAQDPVQVAPNNFKVLLENDQVNVVIDRTGPVEIDSDR